ncbi:hypothetical protein [Nonomuraea recticatena]|uniref:Uncharacterized protein n=1 Tax=Nonomuraea recticatena TaxID=46178 RepID=A0ABP6FU79_9ACTN
MISSPGSAHRARRRAAEAAAHTAWRRGRLAAEATHVHELADQLAAALTTISTSSLTDMVAMG